MSFDLTTLDSVCDVLNGFAFKSEEYVESGIRVIRITNVQKGQINDDDPKFISADRAKEFSRYLLAEGDILISLTGNVGRVGVLTKAMLPAALNQRVGALKVRSGKIDPRFLFHILNSDSFERSAIKNSKGIAQLNLSSKWVEKYKIPLPPLEEQRRIAEILDRADALRQKRRIAFQKLDTLVQSVFLDMFGDPVTNPKGWKTATIATLVAPTKYSLKRGPFGGALKKEIFVSEGFKVYQQQNVIYDDFRSGHYFISKRDYDRMSAFAIAPGDVLVSCSGTIGKIAVVPPGADAGVMNQALLKIRLNETKILTPFFVNLWRSGPFEHRVLGMTHGTGMKNMKSMDELKAINFIVPPIDQQGRFTEIIASIAKQREEQSRHLARLDSLFASAQVRSFRGEL